MNKFLKTAVVAAVASFAAYGSANALTPVFTGGGSNTGDPIVRNFDAGNVNDPFPNVASITFANAQIHPNSSDGSGAQNPFAVPSNSPYLSILANGFVDVSFVQGLSKFAFDWGSRDTYNKLTIYTNLGSSVVVPVPGGGGQGSALENGYFEAFAGPGEVITRVRFDTTQNSFEIDNFVATISAVPEPATWAMMISGFGLAGAAIRRRRNILAVA